MGRPLNGYDLPTAVAAMLEELDGQPPAPAFYATTGLALPGTLEVQADRRGPVAIVVGLKLTQVGDDSSNFRYRANLKVGDYTFIEGIVPTDALEAHGGVAVPTPLLAPIKLDPSTPLKMLISVLPGEPSTTQDFTMELQVLYGSVRATSAVMEAFGEARWWGAWAPRGGAIETSTLTVQIGGRPTYLHHDGSDASLRSALVQLDGRSLTPQALTTEVLGTSFLPHEVRVGQVYQFTQSTGGAGVGRAYWAWHGPAAPR